MSYVHRTLASIALASALLAPPALAEAAPREGAVDLSRTAVSGLLALPWQQKNAADFPQLLLVAPAEGLPIAGPELTGGRTGVQDPRAGAVRSQFRESPEARGRFVHSGNLLRLEF